VHRTAENSRKGAVQESRGSTCDVVKTLEPTALHCFMKESCSRRKRLLPRRAGGRGRKWVTRTRTLDESQVSSLEPKVHVLSAARGKAQKHDASITVQRARRKNDDDLIGTVSYFLVHTRAAVIIIEIFDGMLGYVPCGRISRYVQMRVE
jgi:hypothetical protein